MPRRDGMEWRSIRGAHGCVGSHCGDGADEKQGQRCRYGRAMEGNVFQISEFRVGACEGALRSGRGCPCMASAQIV